MKHLIFFLLIGCTTTAAPVIVPPGDTATCGSACDHLGPKDLHCPEGEPLEDGTTCTTWCENTQKAGRALHPSCVMLIKRCEDISTCQKRYNR